MTAARLGMVTLVVSDYDEAIGFFVGKLGFTLVEDSDQGGGKRWVVVEGAGGTSLLLAKAANERQSAAVGNQTGGRVSFFLFADNFDSTFDQFKARGVHFLEEPRSETYGKVAVFEDLVGNRWDLLEHAGDKP
jgi:catechol 2,3-dioxygenase-like lactoylglutathione lyase family enzyme